MPEDETEQDRLDLMGHCFNLSMNRELHRAPLKDPKLCLDIGTDTGLWALDFADKYPGCEVIGTDLSPIQPSCKDPFFSYRIHRILTLCLVSAHLRDSTKLQVRRG